MNKHERAARNRDIAHLIASGATIQTAANQFGVSYNTARRAYVSHADYGTDLLPSPARSVRKRSTISDRNLAIIQRVFDDGRSVSEVAEEYGITRQRVSQICQKSGLSVYRVRRRRSVIEVRTCEVCGNTISDTHNRSRTCSNLCAGALRTKPIVDGKMECSKCKRWLPVGEFYVRNKNKRYSRCRGCHYDVIQELHNRHQRNQTHMKTCARPGCSGSFLAWGSTKNQQYCSRRCVALENQRLKKGWFSDESRRRRHKPRG